MDRVLLEKLTGSQLVKKFPIFYGTRRFITAFTSAHNFSLSWASSIQSIPTYHTSWKSILILFSHLRLGLSSCLFPSGFLHQNPVYAFPLPIRATCPAHLILLYFITRTIFGEQYRSLSSLLCSLLHSPVTSSLLGPNIPLNTLFSNTLFLRSSLSMNDQVSHPKQKDVFFWPSVSNSVNSSHNESVCQQQRPTAAPNIAICCDIRKQHAKSYGGQNASSAVWTRVQSTTVL